MRPSNRKLNQLRKITIEPNVNAYAEGSCLIKFGNTHVLCTASVEEKVPPFLRNKGTGWVSATYNMLARSTHSRISHDPLKPNGRNIEIQRLIGRSLRSAINMKKLGERQITIDCNVLQADGGTRCASITGGYVALALATKSFSIDPIIGSICGISCGIVNKEVVIDLDYSEDSACEVDCNLIINQDLNLIEIQGTAEKGSMTFAQITKMYELAKQAAEEIFTLQKKAIGI